MGSVEPYETRNGRRYRVRYRTPDRRQTDKRGFRTKREAEDFLASTEVSKMRGEWVDPSRARATVETAAAEWLEAQLHHKPTTVTGYKQHLNKHVLPRWGTTQLSTIQHGEVQAWVNKLATELGPSSVKQIHLVLAGIFKFAIRDGRLVRNPS